jgi:Tfp pilus assembly protein PilP
MSWEYDPCNDSSQDGEDTDMLEMYMEEVRTRALQKLTNLEIAAIFEDFKDFLIRYREEQEDKSIEWKVD